MFIWLIRILLSFFGIYILFFGLYLDFLYLYNDNSIMIGKTREEMGIIGLLLVIVSILFFSYFKKILYTTSAIYSVNKIGWIFIFECVSLGILFITWRDLLVYLGYESIIQYNVFIYGFILLFCIMRSIWLYFTRKW